SGIPALRAGFLLHMILLGVTFDGCCWEMLHLMVDTGYAMYILVSIDCAVPLSSLVVRDGPGELIIPARDTMAMRSFEASSEFFFYFA
ncbi:unnamed protein product, partial [Brassica napus]